jgi:hypothetical protein
MNDEASEGYSIGEFAEFSLTRNPADGSFTILLKGKLRFADLVAHKIEEIRVAPHEVEEWDSDE